MNNSDSNETLKIKSYSRSFRLIMIYIITFGITGIVIAFFHSFLSETLFINSKNPKQESNIFLLMGGAFITISLIFSTFLYLQGYFNQSIEKKLGKELQTVTNTSYKTFTEIPGADETISRLNELISTTKRNTNINLSVGVLTTIAAITVLYSILTQDAYKPLGNSGDLYHYIPRITLVIFIELFSFFFLKLYRRNLEDIKYLNNEITNFECKMIALQVSFLKEQTDSLKGVIQQLSSTERNFVLKSGETTIDAQRIQVEGDENTKLLDKITALLKNK